MSMRGYLSEPDIGDCFVEPPDVAVPAGKTKAQHIADTILRRRLTDHKEDVELQEDSVRR
mgnify:CR=1 FL=1